MKTGGGISKPVLAFVLAGVVIILLALWIRLRPHDNQQTEAVNQVGVASQPQPEAGTVTTAVSPASRTGGALPPVVPISLAGVLVESENSLMRVDPAMLSLPRGTQDFGGIEFWMEGLVHLQGTATEQEQRKNYRITVVVPLIVTNFVAEQLEITQLGSNMACLHLLGGTRFTAEAGTKFADVVWHYADGSARRTPIKYAVHLRDWARLRYEQPSQLPFPFAKVAWRGPHPSQPDRRLRLYRLTLANPEPAKVIRELEFASAMARPSLFFVALTLDPLRPGERPDDLSGFEETDPELTGRLQLIVQDATGAPVGRATVRVVAIETGLDARAFNRTTESDGNGTATVSFPTEKLTRLEVAASHEDLGSRKMIWNPKAGDIIPATYTIILDAGVSIGGMVVDESNNPLADTEIKLYRFWTGGDEMTKRGEQADFPNQTKTTDAQGRWQAKGLPADLLDRISLSVSHPDCVQTNLTVGNDATVEARLRDGTHRLMLQRGLMAPGKVTDESDNPIADARVWAGMVNYSGTQNARTDAQGVFNFRNLKEGEMQFSVLARGRKPEVRKVAVKSGMGEIRFKLRPGNVIRGIVKDELGAPVTAVRIALESPGGGVSHVYEFEMNSDNEGRFAWDGAPDEALNFCFLKSGYEAKRGQTLKSNEENVIMLRKGRKIQGWVLDAETDKPVKKFRVGVGRSLDADRFYADYPGMRDFADANGMFALAVNEEQNNGIKAEADDYAEQIEKLPEAENGIVKVVFHLKASAALRGVVVTPDGAPVAGATVALTGGAGAEWFTRASLKNGRLGSVGPEGKIVTTDSSGQFTLPSPPVIGGLVVAAAETGFASSPVEQVRTSGRLILQTYGRIEGTFKIGGQPVGGQEFMFSMMNSAISTDWDNYKTATDEEGRFNFNKVPPGEGQIVRLIKPSPNVWMHSHNTDVVVEPGKTTRVALGDSGAVLNGRVSFETPPADGEKLTISGSLNTLRPEPSRVFRNAEEARVFYQSPEGKEEAKQMKHFSVSVNEDGSLTMDSIPPGTYTLSISAVKAGDQPWTSKPVVTGQTTITIPDSANPFSPISIGEIVLKPVKSP